jgi:hypothetical protein
MTEEEWLRAADATGLWAFVRDELCFNRNVVKKPTGEEVYNQRLLYLLGVAVCRRLESLFPDSCCQRMIQVAEAYAEGAATLDELADAHEAIEIVMGDEVAASAAVDAVFWLLCTDDYKAIRGVDCATDAVGYLHAIAAGVLPAGATQNEGKAVWKHPTFLAGKEAEGRAVCDLIRDIIGNPFRPVSLEPSWLTWNDGTVVKLAQGIYEDRAFDRLPILADALEEAGCDNTDILAHCRQPTEYVRGCWVVDTILGKT